MPLRWKRRRQREIPQRISNVDMTPLIDLTFLLLITFLITLPLMENSIQVNVTGAIHLNNRPVSIEQLEDGLREAALKDPAVAVLIRGDEKLDYGKIVGVMKVLYKLKITRMALVTQAD
jgi:biopolymer transport protein ExbD